MRPTVLLFDVDGTLITCGGAGRRAIVRALVALGAPGDCAAFSFGGMTDRAIVRRSLSEAGMPVTDACIAEVLDRYLDLLGEEVERAAVFHVHRAVVETLEAVTRPGVAVGLGTGNVERGAAIKLGRVDLFRRFGFGGYGCDAEDRSELLEVGARRGAALLGVARHGCRVVVIGDTPRDIAAARAIGAESVAVATGGDSLEALARHQPTHLLGDLSAGATTRVLLGEPA